MSVAEFLEFKILNPKNPNTTKQQQQQAQHFLSATKGSTNAQGKHSHELNKGVGGAGGMCDTPGLAIFTF